MRIETRLTDQRTARQPGGKRRSIEKFAWRNPRATPLYRLVEANYDEVRGQWEESFEGRHGFWRGFVDEQVRRYLDCGLFVSVPL